MDVFFLRLQALPELFFWYFYMRYLLKDVHLSYNKFLVFTLKKMRLRNNVKSTTDYIRIGNKTVKQANKYNSGFMGW